MISQKNRYLRGKPFSHILSYNVSQLTQNDFLIPWFKISIIAKLNDLWVDGMLKMH